MIHSDLSLGISYDEMKGEQPFYFFEKQRYLGNLVIGPTESGRTILLLKMIQQELFEMKQRELYQERSNNLTLITSHTAVSDRVVLVAEKADIAHRVLYFNSYDKESIKINPLQGDFNVIVRAFHCMFETFLQSFKVEERNIVYEALTYGLFIAKYNGNTNEQLSVLVNCFENPIYLYEMAQNTIEYLESGELFSFENGLVLKADLLAWVQKNLAVDKETIVFQYEMLFEKIKGILKELTLYNNTIFTEEKSEIDIEFFVENGGILLVNTELYEYETMYDYMIGVYFLSRLENIIYSTQSNICPIHHVVLDQGTQYIYKDFLDSFLPNQADYRVSVTIALDTLLRVKNTLGDKWVKQIVEYQRNKFVFGGVSVYDGRIIEEIIGPKLGQVPRNISKSLMIQDAFHITTVVGVKQEVNEVRIGHLD